MRFHRVQLLHPVFLLSVLATPTVVHANAPKTTKSKTAPVSKKMPVKASKLPGGTAKSPTGGPKGGIKKVGPPVKLGDTCSNNTRFRVGRGVYDITGPAAEAQMMGYANGDQTTKGVHMRLRSRAFVLESRCNKHRVVVVIAELGMIFQSVKQGVMRKLRAKYGELYTDDNVLLSATHTHQGPAGHSHYGLYNSTGFTNPLKQGFDPDNYNAIVNGIVKSIERAHNTVTDATIKINGGDLKNASMNRSRLAYANNPDAGQYATDVDQRMTLLKFESPGGRALGMLNWFAVHPTNYSKDHRLITGDNKGIAAFRFERRFGTRYTSTNTFVGAFANANEGDVSPNLWGVPDGTHDASRAKTIAARQTDKAQQLWTSASTKLKGGIDYRHRYVNFSNTAVSGKFTGAGNKRTCTAALGVAFMAGSTEDGPGATNILGVPIHEGMPYSGTSPVNFVNATLQACHGKKPVAMPIGKKNWLGNKYPWTPEVLPVQLVTVGQLAIAAVPFECTTMCGRRIRKTILAQLRPKGIDEVVIAGLSNAYAGYVATKEEYDLQHYEGASTHFGPWTLAALQQEFHTLAEGLANNRAVSPGPTPRNLAAKQTVIPDGVVLDDKPFGKKFGDTKQQPAASYRRGRVVTVRFWGGHPKNNFRTQGSFLRVQHFFDGNWFNVADDGSESTTYKWKRSGVANSIVTVTWRIPNDAAKGRYRIRHDGHFKNGITQTIRGYSGTTRVFAVD
ncbi:MAG: neutral/alkaline non-lysosomal ceramidase N-terminal domain-containing protein [Nannocystaceae bacterium]|nr:neutral/alkaline non-lysosomal ceramidase N-terminal domain-containing protein [Nannocystaceae bacterium]